MSANLSIRILEQENNKRGDLFTRLVKDFFLALGYDNYARFNVQKPGREIDLEVLHRVEKKRAIAECKATATPIGGTDINAFLGKHIAEQSNTEYETISYFLSLSGFTETAKQQETNITDKRIIFINGSRVIEELIKGRLLVSREKAMELCGRCAAGQSNTLVPEETIEVLGHDMGWVWVVYFTVNKQRTHFALIHADGIALAPSVAMKVIEADKLVGGSLHSLIYLTPPVDEIPTELVAKAKERYFTFLSKECGEIPLEGLPLDQQIGSRQLNLDNIFVPLYLYPSVEEEKPISPDAHKETTAKLPDRESVGRILAKYHRLAILAAPGGGKTTLLKRIAIAYAFTNRRKTVDDELPENEWLPLLIRCRQLSNPSTSSIIDLLGQIPNLAEMKDLESSFAHLVRKSLQDGKVLLLIDGLDEISDEGERVAFVKQLRLFLSIYPAVGAIITSREAGFRIIGGALNSCCKNYKIADFDDDDITRLTLAWHKEVLGDQERVRSDAEKLARTICETERVRILAKNPLLLTTLLLVKRSVGQLPSRRSVLYAKAIEVLLMTWNVEGYDPIEQDEAIPRLAFIAFSMMKDGVQQISSNRLKELLILAKKQMSDVLEYTRINETQFVKLIERRSSILILNGHTIENGSICPVYEFRHLTFQEYLTARAIVEGFYPDRKNGDNILTVLAPHIDEDAWKEVVPLAAILAGRNAQPLIQHLIELSKKVDPFRLGEVSVVKQLTQCFLDEVQVAPDLVEKGLEMVARKTTGPSQSIPQLYRGKYGDVLLKVVQDAYLCSSSDLPQLGSSLAQITLERMGIYDDLSPKQTEDLLHLVQSNDLLQQITGTLATMETAFSFGLRHRGKRKHSLYNQQKALETLGDAVVAQLMDSQNLQLQFAASWSLAWLGGNNYWSPERNPRILPRLLYILRCSTHVHIQFVTSWAIVKLPLMQREKNPFNESDLEFVRNFGTWLEKMVKNNIPSLELRRVPLIIGYYMQKPWSDEELSKLIDENVKKNKRLDWSNATLLLKELRRVPE